MGWAFSISLKRSSASAWRGSTPFRILQAVAGGIFGRHSRQMGMDIRRRWSSSPFHCRVRRCDSLLRCQQKTSCPGPAPGPLSGLERRRTCLSVDGTSWLSRFLPSDMQPTTFADLHHRPGWPSIVGRITHRSLRPPLLQLTGYSGGPRWGNAVVYFFGGGGGGKKKKKRLCGRHARLYTVKGASVMQFKRQLMS